MCPTFRVFCPVCKKIHLLSISLLVLEQELETELNPSKRETNSIFWHVVCPITNKLYTIELKVQEKPYMGE